MTSLSLVISEHLGVISEHLVTSRDRAVQTSSGNLAGYLVSTFASSNQWRDRVAIREKGYCARVLEARQDEVHLQ
jgi:hypothetical protein